MILRGPLLLSAALVALTLVSPALVGLQRPAFAQPPSESAKAKQNSEQKLQKDIEETKRELERLKLAREAALKARVKQVKALQAQAVARDSAFYNRIGAEVRKDEDVKGSVERFALLAPGGPIVIEVSLTIDQRPFREPREELIDAMLKGVDKDGDGEASWEDALKSPGFTLGRLGGVANVARTKNYIKSFDLDGDMQVSRYETRRFLARYFQGPAFQVSTTSPAGARRRYVLANGRVFGGGAAGQLTKLLDDDESGILDKSELAKAADRLKSRDADGNDLLEKSEIGGAAARGASSSSRRSGGQTPLAVMLGPVSNPDALYQVLKRTYAEEEDGITAKAFAGKPRLFEQLDSDGDGELTKEELDFKNVKAEIKFKVDVGSEKAGRGFALTGAPAGDGITASANRIAIDLGNVQLRFTTETKKPTVYNFAQTANTYISRYDKDKNEYLTMKEVTANQGLKRQFELWDIDQDGKVFAKEIVAAFDRMRAPAKTQIRGLASSQGDVVFETLDLSGDGRLSLREMQSAASSLSVLDVDKDGAVAPDEVPTRISLAFSLSGGVYRRPGVLPRANAPAGANAAAKTDAPDWFTRMDRNRDGDLTLKEFLGDKKQFEKLDVNKDGFIEPKEAREFDREVTRDSTPLSRG